MLYEVLDVARDRSGAVVVGGVRNDGHGSSASSSPRRQSYARVSDGDVVIDNVMLVMPIGPNQNQNQSQYRNGNGSPPMEPSAWGSPATPTTMTHKTRHRTTNSNGGVRSMHTVFGAGLNGSMTTTSCATRPSMALFCNDMSKPCNF
jgi:hypothetical protein